MAQRLQSICDVDQGWVTKDRGGMVVVGLGNDELHASGLSSMRSRSPKDRERQSITPPIPSLHHGYHLPLFRWIYLESTTKWPRLFFAQASSLCRESTGISSP